jgi:hypothetical protein
MLSVRSLAQKTMKPVSVGLLTNTKSQSASLAAAGCRDTKHLIEQRIPFSREFCLVRAIVGYLDEGSYGLRIPLY